jgi:hypothetical protein
MPALTLLHFENVFVEKERAAETFARALPELQVIMLRDDCWTVVRDPAVSVSVSASGSVSGAAAGDSSNFWLDKWPRRRVVLRTADDYQDPDHEWLLSYHGIQDDLTEMGSGDEDEGLLN